MAICSWRLPEGLGISAFLLLLLFPMSLSGLQQQIQQMITSKLHQNHNQPASARLSSPRNNFSSSIVLLRTDCQAPSRSASVRGLGVCKALKLDFSCTTSRAHCFLSLGILNTLSCQLKRGRLEFKLALLFLFVL